MQPLVFLFLIFYSLGTFKLLLSKKTHLRTFTSNLFLWANEPFYFVNFTELKIVRFVAVDRNRKILSTIYLNAIVIHSLHVKFWTFPVFFLIQWIILTIFSQIRTNKLRIECIEFLSFCMFSSFFTPIYIS